MEYEPQVSNTLYRCIPIPNSMTSLQGITNFIKTVRAGSFAGAARELGISAVAVSKNVAALEKSLGVRLLNRSTRALSLTDEGRAYHERCAEPLQALEDASAFAKSSTNSLSGLLRVTSMTPFGRGYVIPMVQKFCRLYPQIQIELLLDDNVSDMISDGFDVGVRAGLQQPPEAIARKICDLSFVVCAAPDYFSQYGIPKKLEDLATHQCLHLARKTTAVARGTDQLTWRLGSASSGRSVPTRGSLIANDFNALEQAALNGMGLFNAPLPLVMPHFRSGALKPVLPMGMSTGLSIYLHYRSRRNQPARVKVFIDYMLDGLRKQPDLAGDATSLCAPYWC